MKNHSEDETKNETDDHAENLSENQDNIENEDKIEVQIENKARMLTSEWIKGARIKTGDILG